MDKPMSGIGFRLMTLVFKVRDFLHPRIDLLKETGIGSGFYVLDFGCGPGSYIQPLSQLVGVSGVIYALDMHPLAIKEVQSKATRYGIKNIKTIESDCNTGLPDNHVDVALLYDTFHDLSRPHDVLLELYRVLKTSGTLSFSDHHMNEQGILTEITKTGSFKLSAKGKKTHSFSKLGQ